MEASSSIPDAPPAGPSDDEKAGGLWRLLAFVLALALIFASAVMVLIGLNPDDTPRCDQVELSRLAGECFEVGKGQQTIQAAFAWATGVIGAIAALLALYMTFTGKRASTTLKATFVAVVLGAITVLIGQI